MSAPDDLNNELSCFRVDEGDVQVFGDFGEGDQEHQPEHSPFVFDAHQNVNLKTDNIFCTFDTMYFYS